MSWPAPVCAKVSILDTSGGGAANAGETGAGEKVGAAAERDDDAGLGSSDLHVDQHVSICEGLFVPHLGGLLGRTWGPLGLVHRRCSLRVSTTPYASVVVVGEDPCLETELSVLEIRDAPSFPSSYGDKPYKTLHTTAK